MIRKLSISFFLICASSLSVLAQLSQNGTFSLDKVRGCAPLDVMLTLTDPFACGGGTACGVDWTYNGTFATGETFTTPTHTYSTPGTYTLAFIIGVGTIDQIVVEVLPDIPPAFDIYVCEGPTYSITVNVTDTNYDEYVIAYSDGGSAVVTSGSPTDTHAFGSPGTYVVSVRGRKIGYEDNCTALDKNVTVTSSLGDAFISQLTVLQNKTDIQLDFTTSPFTQYKLERSINSGGFTEIMDIAGTTTVTLNGLLTDNNYYCFRLGTYDPCSGNVLRYSNEICSADLDVSAQNSFNRLTWNTSSNGINDFSVSRRDASGPLTPITVLPGQSPADDPAVTCGLQYFYQMTSNYANGSTSISLEKQVTAFSTKLPTAAQNIATIVDGTSVTLEWSQDPLYVAGEYEVFKAASGITSVKARTNETFYTDNDYKPLLKTCYKISYKDICANESPIEVEACPMQVTSVIDATDNNNKINLSWEEYTGYANGVDHYTIQKFDRSGNLLESFDRSTSALIDDISDPDNQVYTYIVKAVPKEGGIATSVSNIIEVVKNPNLFNPTVFTPNGDDFNDVFNVKGQFIQEFELKIFNRWGELIFSTRDADQGWNGTYHGDLMPEGTYAFVARIVDFAGKDHEKSGAVLLLKKK